MIRHRSVVSLLALGLCALSLGCGSSQSQSWASNEADFGPWAWSGKGRGATPADKAFGRSATAKGEADAEQRAPEAAKSVLPSPKPEPAAGTATSVERPSSPTWAPGSHNDGQARIAAIGPHVWIMPKASGGGLALGTLRIGTSVRLRQPGKVEGEGCKRGWYAVEPRGYVCLNTRTTLDTTDPYFLALADVAPRPGTLWPYHYAHSRGAPMYSRVPTPEEWQKSEAEFGPPGTYGELGEWAKGHEELIEKDTPIQAEGEVPWYFEGGTRHVGGGTYDPSVLRWKTIPNGSMLAYGRAFEMYGRVWLVTTDLMIVPADRVQFMRRSTFHGVDLTTGVSLPLAWNRNKQPIAVYRRQADGSYAESGETLAAKTWVEITSDGNFDWEFSPTKDPKYFTLRRDPSLAVRKGDVTYTPTRDSLPRGVKPGQKWIEARILPGTMTAYIGDKPVYATMFSPGKGGLPVKGLDHTIYATTQTGYFPLEWRERVATMSNEKGDPKVLWFSDVPNIQYLKAPLAMHVAYWHEDFGNKKSAECLNLSITDGDFLFKFADPPIPEDWNAVRPGGGNGDSTPVVVSGW
jgi:hypothetical protein